MCSTAVPLMSLVMVVVVGLAGGTWATIREVTPTVGEVWPRPQSVDSQETYLIIRPETFSFAVVGQTCEILTEALQRYMNIIFPSTTSKRTKQPWTKDGSFRGYLDTLNVNLLAACEEQPYQGMDEQYEIMIDSPDAPGQGSLIAMSVWGILRALETFSQLLVPNSGMYNVKSTQIRDFPRFSFRGLMLDTSRHYLPLTKIQQTLDLMAMNKFNVFHWHIVDDQSFPYVSSAYPNLSEQGAYSPSHIYTKDDITNVVQYGKMRGIRVLSEFDTPGHTQSWGSQPGLLTTCYKDNTPDGTFGPIDPSNDAIYDFLEGLFKEVTSRFPDHYVHLGGDEVSFDCWKSNPNITEFMSQQNITGDYSKLEEIYITKVIDIISNLPTKNGYMVWQEVFDNGVKIANDTVVHVWKNRDMPLIFKNELKKVTQVFLNWCHTNETFEDKATFFALPSDLQVHVLHVTPKSKPRCIGYTVLTRMSPKRGLMALSTSPRAILIQVIATFVQVTAAGYNTILSSCWYLNDISYGVDWYKYYKCDPQDFDGTDAQKQLVIGGEACMWGEYVDRTNLIPRTWPRASVVAEKLWSSKDHTNDTSSASPRLEEHRCRLLDRGYDAEPIWPSFCASDVSDPAYL